MDMIKHLQAKSPQTFIAQTPPSPNLKLHTPIKPQQTHPLQPFFPKKKSYSNVRKHAIETQPEQLHSRLKTIFLQPTIVRPKHRVHQTEITRCAYGARVHPRHIGGSPVELGLEGRRLPRKGEWRGGGWRRHPGGWGVLGVLKWIPIELGQNYVYRP